MLYVSRVEQRKTIAPARSTVAALSSVTAARGDRVVLSDVDLEVRGGELAALVGFNGAGKSTLVEVLAGVVPVVRGAVDRCARTAYVPQRADVPPRLPVTVHEVVAMGAWNDAGAWRRVGRHGRRRVDAAIAALGLEDLARRPFSILSGGQRQRALLAQGLASGAELLLLDEPTTGLDVESTAHIMRAIEREVARGAGVLCVTHDAALVERADRVVRVEAGRVVAVSDA